MAGHDKPLMIQFGRLKITDVYPLTGGGALACTLGGQFIFRIPGDPLLYLWASSLEQIEDLNKKIPKSVKRLNDLHDFFEKAGEYGE